MNNKNAGSTKRLVLLAVFVAILLIMSYTPLGYLNIGPLPISLNVIPVALAAVTLGPIGGLIVGTVFGITSFLACLGIGGFSQMGAILFNISPALTLVQRILPRALDGFLLGYIFRFVRKIANTHVSCFVTGFFSAFLNTAFFMTTLVLFYGNTEYMQELIAGRNIIVFICAFVGINAVCEMLTSTVITGLVGFALYKAKLLDFNE